MYEKTLFFDISFSEHQPSTSIIQVNPNEDNPKYNVLIFDINEYLLCWHAWNVMNEFPVNWKEVMRGYI